MKKHLINRQGDLFCLVDGEIRHIALLPNSRCGHSYSVSSCTADYRCVFVCIRETDREIKPVHGTPFRYAWCLKRKEWTNGLYTIVIVLQRNNACNKYNVRINVFRKADELTNFDENNPRDILHVTRGRYSGYDTIKEAEARFDEFEKVALRYLKIYTI